MASRSGRGVPSKPGWVGVITRVCWDSAPEMPAMVRGPAPLCSISTALPSASLPYSARVRSIPVGRVTVRVVGVTVGADMMGSTFRKS